VAASDWRTWLFERTLEHGCKVSGAWLRTAAGRFRGFGGRVLVLVWIDFGMLWDRICCGELSWPRVADGLQMVQPTVQERSMRLVMLPRLVPAGLTATPAPKTGTRLMAIGLFLFEVGIRFAKRFLDSFMFELSTFLVCRVALRRDPSMNKYGIGGQSQNG